MSKVRGRWFTCWRQRTGRQWASTTVCLAHWTRFVSLLGLGYLAGGSLSVWAQAGPSGTRVRVSGTVSDASTKHVVPGVAVRIRRTRQGVVTNAQGDFLLTASPTDTLLFQALGYKPYRLLLPGTSLAQLVVQVRLHRDSIRLREVQVTADRVDRPNVNRALRNLKRPAAPQVKGPQRPPRPKPLFAVDSTPPPPPPTGGGPLGLLYDQFSRAGKERRKMDQLKAKAAQQKARQRVLDYNKAFKDNRGYK
jgi:hypothetical protein